MFIVTKDKIIDAEDEGVSFTMSEREQLSILRTILHAEKGHALIASMPEKWNDQTCKFFMDDCYERLRKYITEQKEKADKESKDKYDLSHKSGNDADGTTFKEKP